MTKRNKQARQRATRTYFASGISQFTPSTGLCGAISVVGIDGIIDALTNQGQELQISQGFIEIEVHEVHDSDNRAATAFVPAIVVSDADITTHNSTASYSTMDQLVELITTGDIEFNQLGKPKLNKLAGNVWWHTVDAEEKEDRILRLRIDITSHLQRFARLLQRPGDDSYYCDIALMYRGGTNGVSQAVHYCISFEYTLLEKRFT